MIPALLILLLCSLSSVSSATNYNYMQFWDVGECESAPVVYVRFSKYLDYLKFPWAFWNIVGNETFYADPKSFIDFCGLSVTPSVLSSQCCYTNLAPVSVWALGGSFPKAIDRTGYRSTSMASAESPSLLNNLPTASNGLNYCVLTSTSTFPSDMSMLWGFYDIAIQEGHNASGISCLPDGILRHEPSGYVNTTANTFLVNLTSTAKVISNKYLGVIKVSFVAITAAENEILWREYCPLGYNVYPTFEGGWEIISLIAVIFCFMLLSFTLYFYGVKYVQKRNPMHLQHFISQCFWLADFIGLTVSLYQYDTLSGQRTTGAIVSALTMFASYYSVLHTTLTLLGVAGQPQWVAYASITSITVIHLALAGSYYVLYWRQTVASLTEAFTIWSYLVLYWQLFAFILLLAPVAFLIYKVVIKTNANNRDNEKENGGPIKRLERLLRKDMYFTGLTAAYISSIGVWGLLRIIRIYSSIVFGGIRTLAAFETIRNCFLLIPFVLNCFFLDHVPVVVANRAKFDQKTVVGVKEERVMLVASGKAGKSKNAPSSNKTGNATSNKSAASSNATDTINQTATIVAPSNRADRNQASTAKSNSSSRTAGESGASMATPGASFASFRPGGQTGHTASPGGSFAHSRAANQSGQTATASSRLANQSGHAASGLTASASRPAASGFSTRR
jgi:hypothetical protein